MRVSVDDPRPNQDCTRMRASAQIRRIDAGQRKRVKGKTGRLFRLGALSLLEFLDSSRFLAIVF